MYNINRVEFAASLLLFLPVRVLPLFHGILERCRHRAVGHLPYIIIYINKYNNIYQYIYIIYNSIYNVCVCVCVCVYVCVCACVVVRLFTWHPIYITWTY
jgi:hypothetical protein